MGSKFLCFSWMLSRDAPPPGLMNERSVRGIHQPDDSVIHGARQIGGQVGELVLLAEGGNARRGHGRIRGLGESGAGRRRFGNENPDEVVVLLAGIAAGVNAVDLQLLVGGKRRNELALAGVPVEPPAVIAAFHLLAVEVTVGKRHAAVRTGVMQRERPALTIASEGQRSLEQHGLAQAVAAHLA